MLSSDNTVLFVNQDLDELERARELIAHLSCHMLAADSADDAFDLLKKHPIDLIISDMRFEELDGRCFLEEVAKEFPDAERILLTSFDDPQAFTDAINRGKISRIITRPFADEEFVKVVEKGIQLADLRKQNALLLSETQVQNTQLEKLNHALEEKVNERTLLLEQANIDLKQSYRSIVRMFSTLTARRLGIKASGDNQKFNKLMISLVSGLELDKEDRKQLFYAWQLRHIGKLSFQDYLINVPYLNLNPAQQRVYHQHPVLAHAACHMVKPLYHASQIILQHKEYLDGSGYPKGLKGDQIKFRAQVLCVINDYLELIYGLYAERKYSTAEALEYLKETASERYNQSVVAALEQLVTTMGKEGNILNDVAIPTDQLRPAMLLSRDLISDDGIMLLSEGQALDQTSIERIREMEFNLQETFQVYVTQ